MWDEEKEQAPLIEVHYARAHPVDCARYLMDVFMRCLAERERFVQMVNIAELVKKHKMHRRAIRDLCETHHVLTEIHVETFDTADGGETTHSILYVDAVAFEEVQRMAKVETSPPAGWITPDEIARRWQGVGIYTNADAVYHFIRRQVVQDKHISSNKFVLTMPSGRRKQGWCADPDRLLKLWQKEAQSG